MFLFGCSLPSVAQSGPGDLESSVWQSNVGLSNPTVQAFTQTADGFLWIGTAEGLFQFDGTHFTSFTRETMPALKDDEILCLTAG
ncbi:MAG: two-component regulator propeller domain-containing protein, partial [Bryocella sp.]